MAIKAEMNFICRQAIKPCGCISQFQFELLVMIKSNFQPQYRGNNTPNSLNYCWVMELVLSYLDN